MEVLKVGNNGCTDRMRVKPIKSGTLILWSDELNKEHTIFKGFGRSWASLVKFDTRQVWTVYHYDVGDIGWVCERPGLYLRLSEKDFAKYFGNYELEETVRRKV